MQPYVWLPGVKARLNYGPPAAGGNSPNVTMDTEKLLNAIDMAAMEVGGVGYVFKWGDVVLDYRALHYNVGGQKLIDEMTASGLSMGACFHF